MAFAAALGCCPAVGTWLDALMLPAFAVAAYLLVVTVLSAVLQRSVVRTLYGARADPYASVAGLRRGAAAAVHSVSVDRSGR